MSNQSRSESQCFQRILAGVLAVGLLLSVVAGWAVIDSRRATWAEAAATSMNLTTALGREIGRTMETLDLSVQSAVRALNTPAFKTLDTLSRRQILFDGAIEAPHLGPLLVVDADGRISSDSSVLTPPAINVADRDYFLVHKYLTVTGLFISRPYQSRQTHEWSIALSRRVTGADGRFAGIVVGTIRWSYFAALFSRLDLGPDGGITLLNEDGALLYHAPTNEAYPGKDVGNASLFDRLRAGEMHPYEGVSRTTGQRMLFAFTRVEGLPLIVSVGTGLATVYADWTMKTALVAVLSVVLLGTGALLLRAMGRQQRGLHQAERRELELSEQGRRESERHHAGKIEAVGRLTAAIAHDFNNYLQTITSSLEIISADYLKEPEAKEIAQIAHKAAGKGAKLTHRLLAFSRQQVLQPRRVGVAFLLADIRKLIADARVFEPGIRCKIAVEPFTDDLYVDATQMESCLLNLLLNARDAMPHGGTLHLSGRNAGPGDRSFGSVTPGRYVILTVRDSGRGMDDITRAHAFEPFFTTKAFGSGAGLGLATAQGFCHQSGGDIRILDHASEPGTTVELWLPAAAADSPADEEVEFNYATIGRRTGRILLVEDEHDVLVALSAILISSGFEVVSVNNGADGLMRLHDRTPYDALLTDHSMPDMTGAEFLARAAEQMPGLPMLILSGGEVDEGALATLPSSVRLLRKPIRRMGLLNAVREAIGEKSAMPVG